MSVMVALERDAGVSLEAWAAGRQLAALLGAPAEAALLTGPYTADAYTAALEARIRRGGCEYVIFPHSYQTRDYAPKLAARFDRPMISDVTGLRAGAGGPLFARQLFQGRLCAEVRFTGAGPYFVSVQAGAFRGQQPEAVEEIVVEPGAGARVTAGEPFRASERGVDLSSAPVIVGVGRGIQDAENLALVESLARALDAEIGASRPACDNGWLPMDRQIGSSGQTVAPKLYLAVGISGAIQHLVGIKGSRTIVAINRDERAPIFEVADYGIAGDLLEIVPALTEELCKTRPHS